GRRLTPARIAHLAACGVRAVEVAAPVRTLALSTGTEVRTAGEGALEPGSLFDADGPGLAAALTEAGAEVVHVGAVPDDADVLLEHVRAQVLAHDADLVITSGGVSMGAFEVVRHAASREGAMLAFPKVAVQPGGPQGIGTLTVEDRRVPWLAFPGNPVSALLSCELIARPALGAPARRRLRLPLQLEAEETSPPALEQYRRARVLPSGRVRLVGGPSSHLIGGYAAADALVVVPVGTGTVSDGDVLETLLIPGGDSCTGPRRTRPGPTRPGPRGPGRAASPATSPTCARTAAPTWSTSPTRPSPPARRPPGRCCAPGPTSSTASPAGTCPRGRPSRPRGSPGSWAPSAPRTSSPCAIRCRCPGWSWTSRRAGTGWRSPPGCAPGASPASRWRPSPPRASPR